MFVVGFVSWGRFWGCIFGLLFLGVCFCLTLVLGVCVLECLGFVLFPSVFLEFVFQKRFLFKTAFY